MLQVTNGKSFLDTNNPLTPEKKQEELKAGLAAIQSKIPEKSLVDYAFTWTQKPQVTEWNWKQMLPEEVSALKPEQLAQFGDIFHFITDPKDILVNYKAAGVKLCMLSGMETLRSNTNYLGKPAAAEAEAAKNAGGRRQTQRKRHQTRRQSRRRQQHRRF
jgi:hypothetical protein